MTRTRMPLTPVLPGLLALLSLPFCAQPVCAAEADPMPASQTAIPPPRERTLFNADWRFTKGDPAGAGQPGFDDSGWRRLRLPHDWGIEGPFDQAFPGDTGKLPWWGVAWYRRHFEIPAADRGRRIALDVDGAMSHATVLVNGQPAGGWPYGYSSFRIDLTPYLNFGGDNVVAIRLDNPPNSSRWYPGGGIYRNVWLVKTQPVHIAHWGSFVTTPRVSATAATVEVRTVLANDTPDVANATVSTAVFALDAAGGHTGPPVALVEAAAVRIAPGHDGLTVRSATVSSPRLWGPGSPSLYAAVTTVIQNGAVTDVVETVFGIRTFTFDADRGLLFNGRQVRIQGVCDHHDLGALGTAVNRRALERQVELLQEMGCNAIRTSHNPPAPELLDLCDRHGILVMDEAFDCWRKGKTPNDYHLLFDAWHERDLRALVRRDRNHPSVILWSIGNEVPDQRTPEGWRLAAHLAGIVHEEDRTRPTTMACNETESGYNGFQTAIDVMGYNYKPDEYARFHLANPDVPLLASETASTISTRGAYFFPVDEDKAGGQADFQMSSYDLYAPRWATTPDAEFAGQERNPFVAGEFVWTGFDYLGEPTPYGHDTTNLLNFTDPADKAREAAELAALGHLQVPSRSSYFGILDLCGFRKDRFYEYQAHWLPDLPMAHLLPHWTWPERVGQVTPVFVTTSGDEAELFLNGRSLGRRRMEPLQYRLRWNDVVYEPGELRVVAYRKGKPWAEEVERTAGPAARLEIGPDRSALAADGDDLAYVTVSIRDRNGVLEPRAANSVRFTLAGPGGIAAVDNGDPTSFEPFQADRRKAFNGLCLLIVRTRAGQTGPITVTAASDGLEPATIVLTAR